MLPSGLVYAAGACADDVKSFAILFNRVLSYLIQLDSVSHT